jgi:hypothetical protein
MSVILFIGLDVHNDSIAQRLAPGRAEFVAGQKLSGRLLPALESQAGDRQSDHGHGAYLSGLGSRERNSPEAKPRRAE